MYDVPSPGCSRQGPWPDASRIARTSTAAARAWLVSAIDASSAMVTKRTASIPCPDCGAAMTLVRLFPNVDDPETELHEFRCEVCEAFAVFKFKVKRSP
jgi:hypothetical protein